MKKVALLAGSSFSAAPIFFALKRRGLDVWVCGKVESDPCHQYADRSFFVDYSVREELLALVQAEAVDYLVPSCNDYSYMSCAWVAEKCDFPGYDSYDTALVVHTKAAFRGATKELGLPVPEASRVRSLVDLADQKLKLPLLVKPDDSFSGRGVTMIADLGDMQKALDDAVKYSRSGSVLVEEFVEGSLHSHSAFIRKGKVVFEVFVDEFCSVYPYQVDCSNHPSILSTDVKNSVRRSIEGLSSGLELADGLMHTQFIVSGSKFWLIETMRRGPGDLYGRLIELSTGVAYHDLLVAQYLREPIPAVPMNGEYRPCSRHTISVDQPVVVHSFSVDIPSIAVKMVPLKTSGEMLDVAPYDKLGLVFAEHRDASQMFEVTRNWTDYVSIQAFNGEDRADQ